MGRCRRTGWISILPMVMGLLPVPASADEIHFALGIKGEYAGLTRTLKINGRRTETPSTDAAWLRSLTVHAASGHLFLGASYAAGTFVDSGESAVGSTVFVKGVKVDVSEMELAVGYSVETWASPYIGYVRHLQRTDRGCVAGCIGRVEFAAAGIGLLIDYPLPNSRSAVYLNTALIQGFSLEGGISYAGIRWPVVGVVGYAYRRIDYPSGGESCGSSCLRYRDVFAGPTVAANYTF